MEPGFGDLSPNPGQLKHQHLIHSIMQHVISPTKARIQIPIQEWRAKGTALFGSADIEQWKFKCPSCGQSQTLSEFRAANVPTPEGKFYFSCIGRWVPGRGCDWTLGGLLQIHLTEVIDQDGDILRVFEFAEP